MLLFVHFSSNFIMIFKIGCTIVAALLHYFFLAAFFIMLAEAVHMYIFVVKVFHHKSMKETARMLLAAWGRRKRSLNVG